MNITYKQRCQIYSNAINKIDDYFEYTNESLKDRKFIHNTLDQVTDELDKLIEAIPKDELTVSTDFKEYDKLFKLVMGLNPDAVITTAEQLIALHEGDPKIQAYMGVVKNNHPNGVWYVLPINKYGASDTYQCNGCHYNNHPSDYISFPQIKVRN